MSAYRSGEAWDEAEIDRLHGELSEVTRAVTRLEGSPAWVEEALLHGKKNPLDAPRHQLHSVHVQIARGAAHAPPDKASQRRIAALRDDVAALEKRVTALDHAWREGDDDDDDDDDGTTSVPPPRAMTEEEDTADFVRKMKLIGVGIAVATVLDARCLYRFFGSIGAMFADPGSERGALAWGMFVALCWSYPVVVLGVTRFLYPEWPVWSYERNAALRVVKASSGTIGRPWCVLLVVVGCIGTAFYSFV